jgi:hypothetical protein
MNRSFHNDFVVRSTGTGSPLGLNEPLEVVCSTLDLAEETYARYTEMYTSDEGRLTASQFGPETVLLIVRGRVVKKSDPKAKAVAVAA